MEDSTGHRPVGLGSTSTAPQPQASTNKACGLGPGEMPCLGCLFLRSHPLRPGTLTYPVTRPSPLETQPFERRAPIGPGGSLASRHSPLGPTPVASGTCCGMTH